MVDPSHIYLMIWIVSSDLDDTEPLTPAQLLHGHRIPMNMWKNKTQMTPLIFYNQKPFF